MLSPLSLMINLSLLARGHRPRPLTKVLMPISDDPDVAAINTHLARAQARERRDATLLQALKMNGGSFWS